MVKKRPSFLSYFSRSSSLSNESNEAESAPSPRHMSRPSFTRRRSESTVDEKFSSLRQENDRLQQAQMYLESVVNALQSNESGIIRLAKDQKLRDLQAEVDKLRQQTSKVGLRNFVYASSLVPYTSQNSLP